MAQQWEVQRPAGVCTVSGRAIEEGEEFYSVLFEEGETFRRADYALDEWQGPPEGSFCHFKTRLPVKEKQKKTFVDNEVLRGFFLRLADETDPVRIQFRFVIALILMRKRILRYEGSETVDGVETWSTRLTRDEKTHRVVNPRLSEDQIEEVSKQLGVILHTDMGDWDNESGDADADGPVAEDGAGEDRTLPAQDGATEEPNDRQ